MDAVRDYVKARRALDAERQVGRKAKAARQSELKQLRAELLERIPSNVKFVVSEAQGDDPVTLVAFRQVKVSRRKLNADLFSKAWQSLSTRGNAFPFEWRFT